MGLGKIEKGYCYLKAFELTQNDPLSAKSLRERSKVIVYNPSDTIKLFEMMTNTNTTDDHFTIYEGDWGKPYAARFEVWFVPENKSHERKLFEKNYKIEGWMH